MRDYKLLFGYAAIIFAVGFLMRSIDIAYAAPTGPNISIGSNPSVVYSGGNTSGDVLLETLPSDKGLILTDFTFQNTSGNSGSIYIRNGVGDITMFYLTAYESKHISRNTGIPLAPNSELYINVYGGSIQYTITGYYAHP
jgi:hypothetical protein